MRIINDMYTIFTCTLQTMFIFLLHLYVLLDTTNKGYTSYQGAYDKLMVIFFKVVM